MELPGLLSIGPEKLKTEERIILAAIRVFSDTPLELASTRQIAKEAGVSLSAIPYYFKTKENLYLAAITRIIDFVGEAVDEKFASQPPVDSLNARAAKKVLQNLIGLLIDGMYLPDTLVFAKIFVREHLTPSPAYDVIYQRFAKKLFNKITKLIQRITPNFSEKEVAFKIIWVFGQVVGFRLGREMLKRHVDDFAGFSEEEIAEIKALVIRTVFRELK
jgi:Transcriptional regulator